jgi:predicted glycosyltransferase
MYSQDGTGLGHLRRTRNIARELLFRDSECSVLVVADSPVAPFFAPLQGMDYIKVPCIKKVDQARYCPNTLSVDLRDVLRLRAGVILQAFLAFQPDLILVDYWPTGFLGELEPVLNTTYRSSRRPKFFLGLRDVLDSPEVVHQRWTDRGVYNYLRHYDGIFVYGCRDMYDVDQAYDLTSYAREVTYCNYVAPRASTIPPAASADQPMLLVMGGGGEDAYALERTFVEALPLILEEQKVRALMLTGPNMPREHQQALRVQAASLPLTVRKSTQDATFWLRQASAVICMGGYNTLAEVLTWRKKALVVPRTGPSAEQRIRTDLFAKRRLIHTLDPDYLTPAAMAEAVVRLLGRDDVPEPVSIPPLDGTQQVVDRLLTTARDIDVGRLAGQRAR